MSSLSPTSAPILFSALSPKLIFPFNSIVFVPTISSVVSLFPILSVSPLRRGLVGTPANTPIASSTLLIFFPITLEILSSCTLIEARPIFISPATFTSCIS